MAGTDASENKTAQSTDLEVNNLRSTYANICKVIRDIGEFTYIIEIKLKDLSIKFQLEENYPEVPPHIIVKSPRMSFPAREALAVSLTSEAVRQHGKYMLRHLVEKANSLVAEIEILPSEQISQLEKETKKSKGRGKSKHVGRKSKRKQHEEKNGSSSDKSTDEEKEEEKIYEKKCPMKTSADVVARIFWDESLPTEYFFVGYLDRYIGIVEKNITAFSWEDIASVDWDTLAIPKHRIEYFKYKSVKFWEKKTRMDNMYGSTGSGITILDVIEKYERECEENQAAAAIREVANQDNTEDQDSESDDDFEINVGAEEEEVDEEKPEPYWGSKVRPTHFLALRITNPSVVKMIEVAQETIVEIEPTYMDCLMPPERLHITLACLGLDSPDQVEKACNLLKEAKSELQEAWNPKGISLQIQDTDHFFNNTLYAKVHCEQIFMNFVEHLRTCIREAGLDIRDVFDFVPHMTIMKVARTLQYKTRSRYMDSRMYDALYGQFFGSQTVDNIYLCEMSEQRQPDGFYISPTHIIFD